MITLLVAFGVSGWLLAAVLLATRNRRPRIGPDVEEACRQLRAGRLPEVHIEDGVWGPRVYWGRRYLDRTCLREATGAEMRAYRDASAECARVRMLEAHVAELERQR